MENVTSTLTGQQIYKTDRRLEGTLVVEIRQIEQHQHSCQINPSNTHKAPPYLVLYPSLSLHLRTNVPCGTNSPIFSFKSYKVSIPYQIDTFNISLVVLESFCSTLLLQWSWPRSRRIQSQSDKNQRYEDYSLLRY